MSSSFIPMEGSEGGIPSGRPSRSLPKVAGVPSWKLWVGRIGIGIILIGFWEFSSGRLMNTFWISKPSLIAGRLFNLTVTGKMWFHLGATLQEVVLGLLIGMAGGIILGIILAYSGVFQHWASPYILALFSLPKASLAPLFVIWFGIGLTSKVFMVVTMVIFVVFYNIYEGIRSIDANLTDMMKTYRAKPLKWLQWVILPSLTTGDSICIGPCGAGSLFSEFLCRKIRGTGNKTCYNPVGAGCVGPRFGPLGRCG